MKIAMFTDAYYPRINGVSVSVKSYAEALTELGHEVCIVCCDYHNPNDPDTTPQIKESDYTSENVKILRILSHHIFCSEEDRLARISQWKTVKHEMDKFKPDIIHINSEFLIGYYGLTYGRFRYVPIIYTFHTLWEDYVEGYIHFMPISASKKIAQKLIKLYLKKADEIICPTQRIADVVKDYKITRPTDILPTGIPNSVTSITKERQDAFKTDFFSKDFPQLQGKRILLYVGRVVKEKNLDFLFPVLKEVQKEIPDTALLIVGGGPELEPLQERTKKAGLDKDVFYTNYVPRENLACYYTLADVFVFPSVTETQGLVTIEAMMSGLPVVAIGEMGTVDVMQGDNGGFMVSNNTRDFSDKVIKLLTDKELHQKKSEDAKIWGNKWDISVLTESLVNYYKKAIEYKKNEK